MARQLKEIILLEGEKILYQLEGNAYTESPNPLAKLIASIVRIVGIIFGWSLRTYIIVTNKRIIRVDKEKILWILPKNIVVLTLAKNSVKEVGYAQLTRWLFFKTVYFRMQTYTENTMIAYNGSLKDINTLVMQVAKIITE